MREPKKASRISHGTFVLAFLVLALSSCIDLALTSPAPWPSFSKRNVQALARDGHLRLGNGAVHDFKRSISTLAKNGQLPTFRAPEDNHDEEDNEEEAVKRNLASIARLKSYRDMKRNLGSIMRTGFRGGKREFDEYNKRNIGSLARNGYLKTDQTNFQKRENILEDEYYFPFYQNPIPPLSELDVPLDYNELYDFQQSNHPDLLPPLSEIYDKRNVAALLRQDAYNVMRNSPNYHPFPTADGSDDDSDQIDKRNAIGLPNHGLYRTITPTTRTKKYIFTMPEYFYNNDINGPNDGAEFEYQEKRSVDTEPHAKFEKRHIGALARLGWLPSFRYSGSRYSRSGRARFLKPTEDYYRKHTNDANFGTGEFITSSKVASKADPDNSDLSSAPVLVDTYAPGGGRGRPINPRILNNEDDIPNHSDHTLVQPDDIENFINAISANKWDVDRSSSSAPKFYNFRSLKVPKTYLRSPSDKRYLLLPAVDNIMLRKTYPNNNLPSRKKNQ